MKIYHAPLFVAISLSVVGCSETGPMASVEPPPETFNPDPAPSAAPTLSPQDDHPSDEPTSVAPESTAAAPSILAWGKFKPNGTSGKFAIGYNLVDASIIYDGAELRFSFASPTSDAMYTVHTTTGGVFPTTGFLPIYTVFREGTDGFSVRVSNLKGEPISWKVQSTVELGVMVIR